MHYKGYSASIEYSAEDDCFIGHLVGINDIVGFHASSVSELHAVFEESVEDYLLTCEKAGIAPQRPKSGKIMSEKYTKKDSRSRTDHKKLHSKKVSN